MQPSSLPPLSSANQPRWWQWPTILSLDAPLVALCWQWLFARTTAGSLHWWHHAILASGVWLAYAADRWIEGWLLPNERVQTHRHRFYQRHRWSVFTLWMLVLAGSVALAWVRLTAREFQAGLFLLAPVLMYLLSHQLVHRHHPLRVPKELCVALLLTGGISVFSFAASSVNLHQGAVMLALFGLLCFADCALISIWEDEVDRHHGQTSLALQYPGARWLVHALPWIISLIAGALAWRETADVRTASLCAAVSGALLGVVDIIHRRSGRQLARVLADFTLLTPLLPWAIAVLGANR